MGQTISGKVCEKRCVKEVFLKIKSSTMQPLIKNNLSQIQELMRLYGVEKAFLFGSAASGKMNADSDVDFLISFSSNMDFETYGNNYFKLLYALQDLLQVEVELVAEETLNNPYLIKSIDSNKLLVL